MSHSQPNPHNNELVPVSANHPQFQQGTRANVKRILKWVLTCLPLGGIAWASFLPLQTWMQQALVLVALIWFFVFFLLDTLFLGG